MLNYHDPDDLDIWNMQRLGKRSAVVRRNFVGWGQINWNEKTPSGRRDPHLDSTPSKSQGKIPGENPDPRGVAHTIKTKIGCFSYYNLGPRGGQEKFHNLAITAIMVGTFDNLT